MAEGLYSQKEWAQFRGPTTSDNYNERIENLYKDLVYLYNKTGVTEESARILYQRLLKEVLSLAKAEEELTQRVEALEADKWRISFYSHGVDDTDRFIGTDFEVQSSSKCYLDSQHGILVLPKVTSSSVSKLYFTDADGQAIVPSTFEARVQGVNSTADNTSAVIDTSQPHNAVMQPVGYIWERNVIATASNPDGAQMYMYVRFPTDLATRNDTNCIILHPFPTLGCDILEVAYSTAYDITLTDSDQYTVINSNAWHDGDPDAVGWIAPGGWAGDEALQSGPKAYYFNPTAITGIRIKLRQRNYFIEDSRYIYSYGLSKLDARYDKFSDTGKIILRFDAPGGNTISEVNNIIADIWNVSEAEAASVFSYRVIWETAYDSGVYTLTPVPLSQRVWIEVTLNKTLGKGTPAVSALVFDYAEEIPAA